MRYVYFLLLVLLMSSCAHSNLRLRKVDKRDRVEVAETTTKKKRTYDSKHKQTVIETSHGETGSEEIATSSEGTIVNEVSSTVDAPETTSSASNEIVAEEIEEDPSNGQKVQRAMLAERDAKKAKTSFVWSLVMLFSMFVPFLAIIAPFSIIPFIIGTIKLSQSNKSDYITLKGERDARSARIMQLIYGIFMALTLIAITIILMVFFL